MGARDKLRAHFLENLGRVMDSEELRVVAGGLTEWARRVRELRNEEGFEILTHNDRARLKPGQYLLENSKPRPAFQRDISKETRAYVLDRNGFTCQMCGAVAGEVHPNDAGRKTRLDTFWINRLVAVIHLKTCGHYARYAMKAQRT
jgi:hypothetical protein